MLQFFVGLAYPDPGFAEGLNVDLDVETAPKLIHYTYSNLLQSTTNSPPPPTSSVFPNQNKTLTP